MDVIGELKKNALEVVRVSIGEYRDEKRIDLRIFFQPAGRDTWFPSRKGISLSVPMWKELQRLSGKIDSAVN